MHEGRCPTIGTLVVRRKGARKTEELPVCLTIFWNRLDGHLVAFYECDELRARRPPRAAVERGSCRKTAILECLEGLVAQYQLRHDTAQWQ